MDRLTQNLLLVLGSVLLGSLFSAQAGGAQIYHAASNTAQPKAKNIKKHKNFKAESISQNKYYERLVGKAAKIKFSRMGLLKRSIRPPKGFYREGEVIVIFRQGVSLPTVTASLGSKGLAFHSISRLHAKKRRKIMGVIKGKMSTTRLIELLKKDPRVQSVSPNYARHMSAMPNDRSFDQLWGLHNTGQSVNEIAGVSDADINAPEAWETSKGSDDVVVAVFDSGVDYTHADLKDNMWINTAERDGEPGVDDDNNGYTDDLYGYDFASDDEGNNDPDPAPIHWHGTHVAGIIGARGDNEIGVTGVNQRVKIMPIKIFSSDAAYDSDILEAIEYVLAMKEKGVNIVAVNASYGGYGGNQQDPMNMAIRALGDAGIVFAVAAGNGANDNDGNFHVYPASYDAPNIIAVAATDQNDTLAWYSCRGEASVDLAAPGDNILSTVGSYYALDESSAVFFDDIESGEGNWTADAPWKITEEVSAPSGTHTWTDSEGGDYNNDTNASLTYSADINLSGHTEENLSVGACFSGVLEEGYDRLYIEISSNSGSSWLTDAYASGDLGDWPCVGVRIPEAYRTEHFRMRFRLESDGSVTDDGVHLDNIMIADLKLVYNYDFSSGTSMATPYVAGGIALMAAAHSDESAYERIDRLMSGVDVLLSLEHNVSTSGRLNLASSIGANLELKPFIAQQDHYTGLVANTLITLDGIKFGNSTGQVRFARNEGNSSQDIAPEIWSETQARVPIPLSAGKFISVVSAEGIISANKVIGSSWKQVEAGDTYFPATSNSAAVFDGKAYFFGGNDSDNWDSNVSMVYDPDSDAWERIAESPFHAQFASSAVVNEKIYTVGGVGYDENETIGKTVTFDPKTGRWDASLSDLPVRIWAGAAISLDDTLYYVGGFDMERGEPSRTLYRYDVANDQWESMASMLEQRAFFSAVAYDGKIYVFGGYSGDEVLSSMEVYDPVGNIWTGAASMPYAVDSGNAVLTPEGIVLAGGVDSSEYRYLKTTLVYHPRTNEWTDNTGTINDMLMAKENASMVYFPERRSIMSVGGTGFYGWIPLMTGEIMQLPNRAPITQNDNASTHQDTAITIEITANDSDQDGDTFTPVIQSPPSHGTATLNSDNAIVYTPETNYVGEDTLTYKVQDEHGAWSEVATVTIAVINRAPITQNDNASTHQDTAITIEITANDSDQDGDTFTPVIQSPPSHGTATLNSDNAIVYTPETNYVGEDTLTYKVQDEHGAWSEVATVTITITGDDDGNGDDSGGGCTYNPNSKGFDGMMLLMLIFSILYPFRRKGLVTFETKR